jgi:hypothetical protein
MVDHVPAGPHYVPRNADHMSSGPTNKKGENEHRRVSELENEIEEYLGLRRSLKQIEIPHEIRSIAENRFKVLETSIQSGSIPLYRKFIQDCEQDKHRWPDKEAIYNERIEEHRRTIANIERARRVVAGPER